MSCVADNSVEGCETQWCVDPETQKVERLRCEAEIFLRIVKKVEGVGFEPTTFSCIEAARKNSKSSTIHLDHPSGSRGEAPSRLGTRILL